MAKMIIDNIAEDVSDVDALDLVGKVIAMGRICDNGKQYCYATSFDFQGKQLVIYTSLNKRSDLFVLVEEKIKE